jgi:hypothetical protein
VFSDAAGLCTFENNVLLMNWHFYFMVHFCFWEIDYCVEKFSWNSFNGAKPRL